MGADQDNIFIERFWHSLKYEEVYLRAYDTVADAKRWIYRYIERYNTMRPYSSLGGKTPDKFHAIAQAEGLLKAWKTSQYTYFRTKSVTQTGASISHLVRDVTTSLTS
jgi:hypothetical protein